MNDPMKGRALLPGATAMRIALLALLIFAIAGMLGWFSSAGAQGSSRAQAERASVDLKQGMTPNEVRELLGKPWRTALSGSNGASSSSPGTLRWTYTWVGTPTSSSSERTLNVDFNAKAAEEWAVSGWNWSAF